MTSYRFSLWQRRCLDALVGTCFLSCLSHSGFAQTGAVSCKPASEHSGEFGCWILSHQTLASTVAEPLYWSLDTFPTRAEAEAAKESNGQVVEALGKVWVFTISGKDDRPTGGRHVTQIGPLPIKLQTAYMVQYMESVLQPGMSSVIHRHPGPEAFYTEAGESCLETPQGKQVSRVGVNVIVPEGEPMKVTASGTETRRSIALVLHDSSHPWSTIAADWKPKGLCRD